MQSVIGEQGKHGSKTTVIYWRYYLVLIMQVMIPTELLEPHPGNIFFYQSSHISEQILTWICE
jgi:hypothetical protein